ncbi:MAG: hypothetical protein JRJ57_06145 [Deltaproteobacteria bacterium]|nr:hypothetical protein [Deltaproteobacteria bacterium]
MKAHVVLFGAGASFGAGDIIPEKPPLGNQLYNRLKDFFPTSWGRLPKEIDEVIAADFEKGMNIVYEQYSQIIAPLMKDMAVYLIQLRPYSHESLYDLLIKRLIKLGFLESFLFSTLNYDCILEFCLLNQNRRVSYWDYGRENSVPVWKLHGSANWFSKDIEAGAGVTFTKGVTFEGGLKAFLDTNEVIGKCIVNQGLYPSMCLFMKGKPVQIAPSIIMEQQKKWSDTVASARTVSCIGVNPLPEDSHIWEPIARTKAKLYFIGDKKAFDAWVQEFREGECIFIEPYFNTGFNKLIKEWQSEIKRG